MCRFPDSPSFPVPHDDDLRALVGVNFDRIDVFSVNGVALNKLLEAV